MPTMQTCKTVLVVEDNELEREGLAALLQGEGYNVLTAANGTEALGRLRADPPPDLVLLDMMMSDQDGWQLLRLVRNNPVLSSTRVVIVTGLGIACPEWANSLGACGLLHKPIDTDELHHELKRLAHE